MPAPFTCDCACALALAFASAPPCPYHCPCPCTSNPSFTIALSLLCANPHLHVRATTSAAADLRPRSYEDAMAYHTIPYHTIPYHTMGYWEADSLSLSLAFLPTAPTCYPAALSLSSPTPCSHMLPSAVGWIKFRPRCCRVLPAYHTIPANRLSFNDHHLRRPLGDCTLSPGASTQPTPLGSEADRAG